MSEKTAITTPTSRALPPHFSTAIAVPASGRLVFISGMTARHPDGHVVGVGDAEAQTHQVCANLKSAVEAAGGTMADICSVDVYLADMADYAKVNAVRQQWFPSPPPASTLVEVSRFVVDEYLVEISAVAVVASS